MADINWDVIPFDWMNDANTAPTTYMLKTQIKPGSVVLFHDTYSSTVDCVPVHPRAQEERLSPVTVSQLLDLRAAAATAAGITGPPINDSPTFRLLNPTLPNTRRRNRCRTSDHRHLVQNGPARQPNRPR